MAFKAPGLTYGGTLTGNLTITGNLTVQGNFNFGNAVTDTLTVSGAMVIDAAETTTDTLSFTGTAQTTGMYIDIDSANSLSTGRIFRGVSNSSDTSTRELMFLHNDNTLATGTTVFSIRQDAAIRASFFDQDGNAEALVIDTEATTAHGVDFLSPAQTTGNIIDIGDADALTTGSILNLVSNSASTGSRNLVRILNDNALASGAIPLSVRNDGAEFVADFDGAAGIRVGDSTSGVPTVEIVFQNNSGAVSRISHNMNSGEFKIGNTGGNGHFVTIVSDNTEVARFDSTAADVGLLMSIATKSTGHYISIPSADTLSTGRILNLISNSSSTGTRSLVYIQNDNSLATGTECLTIVQDAANNCIDLTANAGIALQITSGASASTAINIDSSVAGAPCIEFNTTSQTTESIIKMISANSLTTGSMFNLVSNAADTSTRNLITVTNDNTAATGATVLNLKQDAAVQVAILNQTATAAGSSFIDFQGTAAGNATGPISTLTTSGAATHHLQIEINGTKAWIPASTTNPT